ncbi:hydrogenase expression/formation protein HypC [Sporomusaceae bacterium BoRhaA]|uniref:HypC/HybG/HupF family hydrogenase formation chaperone n=1 Tax=Pelorhabdus rhamnosifermentans TaxID=2772457 RepID=UPI001C0614BF|nr:HypC/HybG/HupF family hydrogenase formation chaperone [Pelorhabdus rhamnosifermentans]MBU2702375.1 hydrogenase expression/formation protein HypC [Pelorhabdus rhamnosifermentans]
MCLAIPAKLIGKIDRLATVEVGGITRKVSLMLLPDAQVGDFVLVHAGFAIQTVEEEEAKRTMELLKELTELA